MRLWVVMEFMVFLEVKEGYRKMTVTEGHVWLCDVILKCIA